MKNEYLLFQNITTVGILLSLLPVPIGEGLPAPEGFHPLLAFALEQHH